MNRIALVALPLFLVALTPVACGGGAMPDPQAQPTLTGARPASEVDPALHTSLSPMDAGVHPSAPPPREMQPGAAGMAQPRADQPEKPRGEMGGMPGMPGMPARGAGGGRGMPMGKGGSMMADGGAGSARGRGGMPMPSGTAAPMPMPGPSQAPMPPMEHGEHM
jgi:hypothetical protein